MLQLHEKRQHEEAIAVIQAALTQGHLQPWMYEVLAATMKAAGRPGKEIERVILSSVDFQAADVPDMLFAAAYLARFEQNARALELYRQASEFAPTRPEPYVLGLKLARQSHDADAVLWAGTGILSQGWTKDYQALHQEANEALAEAEKWLEAGKDAKKLEDFHKQVSLARQRDLSLKLTWSGTADLDLIVEEPLGTECSLDHRYSRGGGVLVHDGVGPKADQAYELYVAPKAASGKYKVRVRYIGGQVVAKQALLTITRHEHTPQEKSETISIPVSREDSPWTFTLENGRLTELLPPIPEAIKISYPTPPKRRPTGIQLTTHTVEQRQLQAEFQQGRNVLFQQIGTRPVAFSPNVRFLSEGVTLPAMAVVSGDRRYVRLSLNPTFTGITDVFTFTYVGGP